MRNVATMKAKTQIMAPADIQPGMLVKIGDAWEAVAVAPYAHTNRSGQQVVTLFLGGTTLGVRKITDGADSEREAVADSATVRLSKAQAALLRKIVAGLVSFVPSNHDHVAPSHAHRDMFITSKGGRKSNCTLSGVALYELGMIDYDRRTRKIETTTAADIWLAAHPA